MSSITNPKIWFTYLLECADGTLYCGVTTDLTKRLRQHNGELVGGAKYTAVRRPVVLRASWSQDNRSEACKFESQVKGLTRAQKLSLISDSVTSESSS